KLGERYEFIYGGVGWDGVDAMTMEEGELEWIGCLWKDEKVVGIGEIGLDYDWDT
ncbi:TatD family hydrolase, partial [Paenibacillus xylanexedens]|uniref:TatD family hydrolase n=1 Tax=Paenibacillus xylanexedens TaxID=528191 RepID=UPI0016434075